VSVERPVAGNAEPSIAAQAATPFSDQQLRAIQELYGDGLALRAYELGKQHAPLEMWLASG